MEREQIGSPTGLKPLVQYCSTKSHTSWTNVLWEVNKLFAGSMATRELFSGFTPTGAPNAAKNLALPVT